MAFNFPAKYHIYPDETIEAAIAIINELGWHLRLVQGADEKWYIGSGEDGSFLFVSDQRSEVEAFIFGMALTLATVPGDIYNEISKNFRESL